MSGEDNLQRMKTLDDPWNGQDWQVFRKRHSADTAVYWPGQPGPTRLREAHQAESEAFSRSIENHLDNNPHKVMFACDGASGAHTLETSTMRWSRCILFRGDPGWRPWPNELP
jgi:hypothetical protein